MFESILKQVLNGTMPHEPEPTPAPEPAPEPEVPVPPEDDESPDEAHEEMMGGLEDEAEAEVLRGEAPAETPEPELDRHDAEDRCPYCRRGLIPPGECEHDWEPISEEVALGFLGPILEHWDDPDFLSPPAFEADLDVELPALKAFLENVDALAAEARVVVTPEGWAVKAVDPAHVAMIEIAMPRERFSTYDVRDQNGKPVDRLEVGIDVEKLLKALKGTGKGVTNARLRFSLGAVQREWLEVHAGGSERGMAPVDTAGMTDPRFPPGLKFEAGVAIDGKVLYQIVRKAGEVADYIELAIEPMQVRFETESDVDRFKQVFEPGKGVDYLAAVAAPVRSLYPLDYLAKILKTLQGSCVELWTSTDYPLKIVWDGPHTKGVFLVAPRIESDDF